MFLHGDSGTLIAIKSDWTVDEAPSGEAGHISGDFHVIAGRMNGE